MARPSAQEAYAKWSSRVQASGQFYQQGVQNSKDWAAAAVSAGPARDAGIQQAIADGRIDRGIQRTGTAGWRNKTLAKGPAAWSAAVASPATQQAYMAGYQKLSTMLDAGESAIASIPRGGFAANIQRMTAFATAVHNASEQAKQSG
jgi:hypothetical protein